MIVRRCTMHVAGEPHALGQACSRCGEALVAGPGARAFAAGEGVLAIEGDLGPGAVCLVAASQLLAGRDRSDEFDCGVVRGRGAA